MTANTSQHRPTTANASQWRPMMTNASQRHANDGQWRPMQANTSQHKPTTANAGQWRPTTAPPCPPIPPTSHHDSLVDYFSTLHHQRVIATCWCVLVFYFSPTPPTSHCDSLVCFIFSTNTTSKLQWLVGVFTLYMLVFLVLTTVVYIII
jgi:hypothetical protein